MSANENNAAVMRMRVVGFCVWIKNISSGSTVNVKQLTFFN